jgi:putative membrane protein
MINPRSIPYRAWLLIIFVVVVVVLGIDPYHHGDYLLEHSPTLALLIFLYFFDRRWTLSSTSATLIFIFLLMHALGAHYLYSRVPYDEWMRSLFSTDISTLFGFERNHYDRLVHLCFGLIMVYPMREVVMRYFRLGPIAGLVIAVAFLAVGSKLYELGEWLIALLMDPEAAERYNGQQGDLFDAHKDMALALTGSLISAAYLGVREKLGN